MLEIHYRQMRRASYQPASFDSMVDRMRGVLTYGLGGGSAYEPIAYVCLVYTVCDISEVSNLNLVNCHRRKRIQMG